MLNATDVKLHLRIDYDDEDTYLNILLQDATETITSLTGIENDFDAPKMYRRACLLLVADWFKYRENTIDGNPRPIPYGVNTLVGMLRRNEDMF